MNLNLDLIATTKSRVEAEIDAEEAEEERLELIEIGRRHGELEALRAMAILNCQNGANKIGREPMLHEITAKQSASSPLPTARSERLAFKSCLKRTSRLGAVLSLKLALTILGSSGRSTAKASRSSNSRSTPAQRLQLSSSYST